MRRFVVIALLLIAATAWATGQRGANAEWVTQDGPISIGLWGAADRPLDTDDPDGLKFYADYVFADMDVELTFYSPGATGSAQPIDLDIAAGKGPDIYYDYMGRTSKYANARYAVDIAPYVGQEVLDQYIPSFLALMNKDGVQYGLPGEAWISTMIVNKTLLERVGMGEVIDDRAWTMDEFMEASRRVKALREDFYGYMLFSATSGGDYWFLGFLPSFGANLYDNGKIGLNTPEGIRALEWYRDYAKEGLAPPGASALGFSDFLASFQTGKFLAYAHSPSNAGPTGFETGKLAFEAGNSDYEYEMVVCAFPSATGNPVPLAIGPDGGMIFRKPSGVSHEMIDAFLALTGKRNQEWRVNTDSRWSSLKVLDIHPDGMQWAAGNEVLLANGVWDMGIGLAEYGAVRALVPPLFQAIYTGELTVQEAVDRFEKEGNAALAGE